MTEHRCTFVQKNRLAFCLIAQKGSTLENILFSSGQIICYENQNEVLYLPVTQKLPEIWLEMSKKNFAKSYFVMCI